MWAVVGLGNPGVKYSRSRHNIGFMVVDEIARKYDIELVEKRRCALGKGSIEGERAALIEPVTFMNRSGLAVLDVLNRLNIPAENLIVICDDLDMETGKIKIKKSGSSGGHKGVESVIRSIGTGSFIRVKIGIGRDPEMLPEDYVLKRFKREEIPVIKAAVRAASEAVAAILAVGVERAMNRYNVRRPEP